MRALKSKSQLAIVDVRRELATSSRCVLSAGMARDIEEAKAGGREVVVRPTSAEATAAIFAGA